MKSARIDDAAADWAARVDRGQLAPSDAAALDAWLARDTRHLGAFARARAMLVSVDQSVAASGDASVVDRNEPADVSRRRFLRATASAAALLAAVGTGFYYQWSRQRYSTHIGEMRRMTLVDGSTVTMNTASEISVAFTDAERHVRLVAGEALFDVAKDHARPFIVEAADTSVRAVGTSFIVRQKPGQVVEVLVREGIVEVAHAAAAAPRPVRLIHNTMVRAVPEVALEPVTVEADALARKLAWMEGRIAFEGQTLREAADEFARYSEVRIIIEDPAIARRSVVGLFAASDPIGFARAVAESLELRAQVSDGEVRLSAVEPVMSAQR